MGRRASVKQTLSDSSTQPAEAPALHNFDRLERPELIFFTEEEMDGKYALLILL